MGGGPKMPPFARLKPPTETIPEEVELVWDDSVAPETCIDFDAPHISTSEMLWSIASVAAMFGALYTYVVLSDPEGSNPVAKRETVIPASYLMTVELQTKCQRKKMIEKFRFNKVVELDDERQSCCVGN